jgi:oxygen-independent coproporphyrinogen-3 oxidase
MNRAGIYLHIPFCKAKCNYCDFYSVAGQEALIPSFVNALIQEIKLCDIDPSGWILDSLFLGGGTPSILDPDQLEAILNTLEAVFGLSAVEEMTLEANPGEINLDKLRAFHSIGVNRLSLGGQSLEPDLLNFLTRIHSADQVLASIEDARKAGFTNVNCDLIFNIPGQSFNTWKRDLETLIRMDLEHLSCYSLTVEAGTPLYQQVKTGTVTMPDSDRSAAWYYWTQQRLEAAGFEQYEISNWAKPGFRCRQNLHYWRIEPYLGFGPSAHGFDGKRRYSNDRSVNQYIEVINQGKLPREAIQTNSELDYTNELVGFGLRTADGIQLQKIPRPFQSRIRHLYQTKEEKWGSYCKMNAERIWLTPEGFAFADEIAVDLIV